MAASEEEVAYICDSASAYFAKPVTKADIVWVYSGVRPLHDKGGGDAQAATRDYVLSLEAEGQAPLLSVFGGKLTTYRRLAEHALTMLEPHCLALKGKAGWTGRTALSGGDFPIDGFDALLGEIEAGWPFLTKPHARRLARLYGTQAKTILRGATTFAALGRDFGATLTAAEVTHLVNAEWARRAEDIVWRRTKLGLRMTPAEVTALDEYLQDATGPFAS